MNLYDDDDERVYPDDQAMRRLIELHREEYDELRRDVIREQRDALEAEVRRQTAKIRKLEEKLQRAAAQRARSTERVKAGVTRRAKR